MKLASILLFAWISLIGCFGCANSPAKLAPTDFDLAKNIRAASLNRTKFEQASIPLACLPEDPANKIRTELADVSLAMQTQSDALNSIIESAQSAFRRQFDAMEKLEAIDLRIGIRHEEFSDQIPDEFVIEHTNGSVDVTKNRSAVTYHVCVDQIINEGPAAILKFRLPVQGRRGGTPVPYLGIRDDFGNESVVVRFNSRPNPHKSQDVYLYRTPDELIALYDNHFYTTKLNRIGESAFIFFHMNDESRVIIDEVWIHPD